MDFQQAFNAPGNWIQMRGIPVEYNQKSGQWGPYALGKLQDDNGQQFDIMFSGSKTKALPQQSLLNQSTLWAVRYDANTQKLKALFNGFANQPAGQPVQGAPPAPPQNAPQQPIQQNKGNDPQRQSIERQCVVKAVMACPHCPSDLGQIVKWFTIVHKWVETGQDIPTPDPPYSDEPPIDDQDPPF